MTSFNLEDLHKTVVVEYLRGDNLMYTTVNERNIRFRPDCVRRDLGTGQVVIEGEDVGTYRRLAIPLKDIQTWSPLP